MLTHRTRRKSAISHLAGRNWLEACLVLFLLLTAVSPSVGGMGLRGGCIAAPLYWTGLISEQRATAIAAWSLW